MVRGSTGAKHMGRYSAGGKFTKTWNVVVGYVQHEADV